MEAAGQVETVTESVLVVDDEASVRKALARVLKRVGYDIREAESAEQALELLSEKQFACAVTDMRMPGMGGHGFIERAKSLFPQMPVVAISGNGDMQDVIECLRNGATDFIVKPWEDDYLRSAIQRAIRRPPPSAPAPPQAKSSSDKPAEISQTPSSKLSEEVLIERLRSLHFPFPMQPKVALTTRLIATGSNATPARLKTHLESHSQWVERILRVANTPYYGGYGRGTELAAAISRIGIRETSCLVDTLSVARLHTVSNPKIAPFAKACWQNTWTRAVTMKFLAQELPGLGLPPNDAYLSALFCNMGAAFLYNLFGELDHLPEKVTNYVAELHTSVGGAIADAWGLSPDCVELVRCHHEPVEAKPDSSALRLLRAAEALCVSWGIHGDPVPIDEADPCRLLKLNSGALSRVQLMVTSYMKSHELLVAGEFV